MDALLLALALEDAILTLACVGAGATEANPLMCGLLALGPAAFVFVKLAVAALGAIELRKKAPRALAFLAGVYFATCLASLVALFNL